VPLVWSWETLAVLVRQMGRYVGDPDRRLSRDIFEIPHHCFSAEERGDENEACFCAVEKFHSLHAYSGSSA
jgi:hypothetical protein